MRREERHHLKDNPLATALARVQAALHAWGRTLAAAGVVVALAAAGAGGYFFWQQQRANRAGELLADALIVLESRIAAPPESADGAGEAVTEWVQPAGSFPTEAARLRQRWSTWARWRTPTRGCVPALPPATSRPRCSWSSAGSTRRRRHISR